jgi:hypothetical protein
MLKVLSAVILLFFCSSNFGQNKMPTAIEKSALEPIKYTGELQPVKQYYDGGLPHAVGVHNYQVFRSNRINPTDPGEVGYTYNHQPYLAYWNGKFYLQFLQGLVQEHEGPTRVLHTTSEDGLNWNDPIITFPTYKLPSIIDGTDTIPENAFAVMHQRMGFYVTSDNKLLTLGFYGYAANTRRSPNAGNGLGRVVREIYKDGTMGPIYFIRYNHHAGWNESNTTFPCYQKAEDKEFIKACEELLGNKLITLQWWEEDRAEDGFYVIDPSQVAGADYFSKDIVGAHGAGKAFAFYHRPDGVVVGIWKNQYTALSSDEGKSWTKIVRSNTLWTTGAKTWGQKTEDSNYAIVHTQSATKRNRFPLVALVGEDGHEFDKIFVIHGEVPQIRYQGIHKTTGPQYIRGITEGNGNPPGSEMWNTYSVNKEDIWVSKTHVPIIGSVDEEVNENFENINSIEELYLWNIYTTKWAPISVQKDKNNTYLELRDEEPYDYAKVERVFPKAKVKEISFSFNVNKIETGRALEIEVQDQGSGRPLKLRIDKEWLGFDIESARVHDLIKITQNQWHDVKLLIDCNKGEYRFSIDGKEYKEAILFNDKVEAVERIVFRTGPHRNYVETEILEKGTPLASGLYFEDMPGSGEKTAACVYFIDNIITK